MPKLERTGEESLGPAPLMVERIYVGIAPGLVGHASRNVQAHLFKLEDEGRVEQHGDEWVLTI